MKPIHSALVLLALTLLLAAGCTPKKEWTPYTSPPDPNEFQVDTIDGEPVYLGQQTEEIAAQRSAGCLSCHESARDPHADTASPRACVDCHGGNGQADTIEEAHPKPKYPDRWKSSANPERTYALLNNEHYDWIRFVNPGDLRVANDACGPCHPSEVLRVSKHIMTNAAHFWGVAAYANGIVSTKYSAFGESYSREGIPQMTRAVPYPKTDEEVAAMLERSEVPLLLPLPQFEISQTANIFRVFERGSRLGTAGLGFNGLNVPIIGLPDKLEDPGQPNNKASDRGLGTLNRVDLPLLNVHKTRLNDPMLSFLGTNDQPGDYRSSGCTGCHMVYANDRSPIASGPWAVHGNTGMSANEDPAIPNDESGHPIKHEFTTGAPTSQCMVCHHHQPNSFVNPYLGFTMWTYETDGQQMFPAEEKKLSNKEMFELLDRNPEGAARQGLWQDPDFLKDVAPNLNSSLKDTQFADYHGHGWNFRGAFKLDREGNYLDKDGNPVDYDDDSKFQGAVPLVLSEDDPDNVTVDATAQELKDKFSPKAGKAVHLKDIHAELGMHCVDCHFEQDVHGNGKLYVEYQAAIEIRCQDCHGTVDAVASLQTSGPARIDGSKTADLENLSTPFGDPRFEWEGNTLVQRSMIYPDVSWNVRQVRDTVATSTNTKATYAHTLRRDGSWGTTANPSAALAHNTDNKEQDGLRMECYTCHTSWITSCWGCHLPQQANWKTEQHHYEPVKLRNYATYNPQVARDSEWLLGIAPNVKENTLMPVRSSSAVTISSMDGLRRQTYPTNGTTAANGMSGQCFNTHFTHTVRTTETRACSDCHISENNDNNAYLAQAMLLGTNTVNFMGYHVYVGVEGGGYYAVRTTEFDEPQAVIGSQLHKMAYPERHAKHVGKGRRLKKGFYHMGPGIRGVVLKGEYLYTAGGKAGFRAYDVANVANKDFSQKTVTAPVSPLGQRAYNDTRFATGIELPTNNYVTMSRLWRPENKEQPYEYEGRKQNMHEIYRYAYVSDRYEGLVVIDADCLTDGDPQNNFTKRVATFNPDGKLNGAENLAVAGTVVYMCCESSIVAVSIEDPKNPQIIAEVPANGPTSMGVQFRYGFFTDKDGVKVVDVTYIHDGTKDASERMKLVPGAEVPLATANNIYVAKTYGYVAAGAQGLVILDLTRPEQPRIHREWDAEGQINDLRMVKIAMTNDSVYAYMADGKNGLRVAEIITPFDGGRSAYGFAPGPERFELISHFPTRKPAVCLQKGLDRDRAVDESGNQHAVFGRIGGRPMNLTEMQGLYMRDGEIYTVSDNLPGTGGNSGSGGTK